MTTMHVSRSSPGNGGLPPCGRVSVVAAGASAGCILRLRGGNWEYGVERKFVRGHYDPHGSEFQVDPGARANAGSRRRIVVVADGEIIQPKSSSSLRAALRSKSRRTTFVRPEMPEQPSGELWGSHGVKEMGVGLSLIPPMHPEAPLGLLQVAFPAAGMLFCPGMTGSSELHAPCGQLYARQECVWMRRAVQGMCWTAPGRIGRLAVPSGGLIARPA